jgi:hypothetical protein
MTGWQYLTINLVDLPPTTDEVAVLNAAGAQGWELVRITSDNMAYLKRPLEEREQTTDAPRFERVSRRRTTKPLTASPK